MDAVAEIEIANPVIKDADPELDALRENAEALDRGEVPSANEVEQRAPTTTEPTATPEDKGKSDNSEITPEKTETKLQTKADERPRDEHGRFLPKDETKIEGNKIDPETSKDGIKVEQPTKPETPYEQAKREGREREARAWQKIEQEKADIARQRAELQSAMTQRKEPARDESKYTAEDYEKAAEEFLQAGDHELYNKAKDAAKAIRVSEQRVMQDRQRQEFENLFVAEANKVFEEEPDAQKQGTPIFNKIAELAGQAPEMFQTPKGFRYLYEHAKVALKAGMVSELEAKNKQLQAEVDRLNGLTRIDGSGPTSPSAPAKFEEKPIDDQLAELKAAAERLDQRAA